jgi:tetratricopeptide (TPR) repeat protein
MPVSSSRFRVTRSLLAAAAAVVMAQGVVAEGTGDTQLALAKVDNSAIDAPLFYQLLIGEIQLREGESGAAFQVILDAARRTKDEQLFRRATDIALQARAGDQALVSAKAWRQTLPESLDALRYLVQLLVALNRPQETLEPLQALLKQTPPAERPSLITALPRFFARSADKAPIATLTEQVLRPYVDVAATRVPSLVTNGRSSLAAQDNAKALALAQSAHAQDPAAEGPAVLALELPPGDAATAIVRGHLAAKPDSNGVRLLYVRALLAVPLYAEATAQLETLTRTAPQLAQAWLTLGALHLQLREPAPAIVALKKYVELVQAGGALPKADAETADDDAPASAEDALTRAWLLLAQAADLQGDFRGSEAWLAKIEDPQRALEVQTRRASLLARQGKLAQARELIRRVPEKTPADARAKLLAEAQVLRDAKQWAEANTLLAKANVQFADDVDLIYEQSMMLEKLNKLDDMERLLRRVIALKPDHQHAYNALGYSLAERNVRLPEARTLIKKALDLSPGEPSITDSLGWVEYRLGNREEAVRLLRDAYRGQPDAEIAAHLGEVLWISGQKDEARKVWREGRGKDAGNEVLRETLARLRVDL